MNKWKTFALCAACLAALSFSLPECADAARMGGGRSFGSSSIMSRPATPPSGALRGGTTGINRQAPLNSTRTDGGAATMTRSNTGLLGGLFGGLLAGTFLGSLFGGHGMVGGMMGGLMNLLILGLLVYFGVRLFRRVRGTQSSSDSAEQNARTYEAPRQYSQGSAWDNLRSEQNVQQASEETSEVTLPADFDQEEFLRGAKAAYTRMQASWDRRDLDDIANFATEDVMKELRRQAEEDPNPGKTEILLVNASVIEVRDEGDLRRVAVYFDVLMREDQRAARPEQVREVWHFVCSRADGDSWKLDGIQQLS